MNLFLFLLSLFLSISVEIVQCATAKNYSDIYWDASSPTEMNGVIINGVDLFGSFGSPVELAGDINGDGYDDFLIGAPGVNNYQGAAYVIFGSKDPLSSFSLESELDGIKGFAIFGAAESDSFGSSLSRAGDVNNDGIEDIIIGALNSNNGHGTVYVIFGRKGVFSNITLSSGLSSGQGFALIGASPGDNIGVAVSRAGDMNGDGVDDVVFSSYAKNDRAGIVYVIFGRQTDQFENITLSNDLDASQGFIIFGPHPVSLLGFCLDNAGDVNGDGIDDIIIGAYGANGFRGSAYIIFGKKTSSLPNILLSSGLNEDQGFAINNDSVGDYLGMSVSGIGDMNNDGIDDILVGAAYAFGLKGSAYVVFGSKSGLSNITANSNFDPKFGFAIFGGVSSGLLGSAVGKAGDINRDGIPDIIIGATQGNNGPGIVYVVFGNQTDLPNIDLGSSGLSPDQGYTIFNTESRTAFGASLSGAGDVNKDGVDDILIGAFQSQNTAGAVYIIFSPFVCPKECKTCTASSGCLTCEDEYTLQDAKCIIKCPDSTHLINGKCEDNEEKPTEKTPLGSTAETTKELLDSSSVVARAFSMGSSVSVGLGLIAKMIQNVRYLNISYSEDTIEAFESYNSDLFNLDIPNSFYEGTETKDLSFIYTRYDLNPSFLENYLQNIILVFSSLGIWIMCKLIQCSCLKKEKKESLFRTGLETLQKIALNFAIIQIYSGLDDIMFFFILEVSSTKMSSIFAGISLTAALIFLLLGVAFLYFNYWVLYQYQTVKKKGLSNLEKFKERFEVVATFFDDFKDNGIFQQSFFALSILRCVILIVIITLVRPPLVQAILMMAINVLFVIYLISKRPFQDLFNEITQYFCELIVFVAYTCVIILAIIDYNKTLASNSRETLGKCIILSGTILSLGGFIIQMIQIIGTIYQLFKYCRKFCKKTSSRIKLSPIIDTRQNTEQASGLKMNTSQISSLELSSTTQNCSQSIVNLTNKSTTRRVFPQPPQKTQHFHYDLETTDPNNDASSINERTLLQQPLPSRRKILRRDFRHPRSLRNASSYVNNTLNSAQFNHDVDDKGTNLT